MSRFARSSNDWHAFFEINSFQPSLYKSTKNQIGNKLLEYKGMQAGEVDWRPTETIPEDFCAIRGHHGEEQEGNFQGGETRGEDGRVRR
jgi:hypothetical protein